jgi:putative nucleotidyltransferase with HDIG domain
MQRVMLRTYVAAICAAALFSGGLVPWSPLFELSTQAFLGFGVLLASGLLSERLAVGIGSAPRGSGHTITFIPLLAVVLLFGSAAAVTLMAVTGITAELFFRRKERIRSIFNAAQIILSASIAGIAFERAGGVAAVVEGRFQVQMLPSLIFLLVFLAINHVTVSVAISLAQRTSFRYVWIQLLGPTWGSALVDILVSPLAMLVAFSFWEWGPSGVVVSTLPLFFIRHAYLNIYRLQQSNRDLLTALVKAIEVRDPYTSGHSQRVSHLAGEIARALKLRPAQVETIEMAALLHDVGKIDAVYSELLRKPHALSNEERKVMESHVEKGVELLQSMSSVSEVIIESVHHHHEKMDGTGYPRGLSGHEISIGGRIIKICDSIDAMLSDRPYRDALSLNHVKAELNRCVGVDFDPTIVEILISSRTLEKYAASVRPESLPEAAPSRLRMTDVLRPFGLSNGWVRDQGRSWRRLRTPVETLSDHSHVGL